VDPTTGKDNPGVIAFPPLIWLVCAVAGGLAHLVWPHRMMLGYGVSLSLGIILILVAPSLALWALRVMKQAGTNVDPSQPALTIVRTGPFRFTRNPMYLALCLLQLALSFFLNDWGTLLFVIPLALVLHFGVILREEKYLAAKFGQPYLQLKREVRRWI
jgi:protein-S-isoprenylcysteine O-methyltransferase Ste14